MGFENPMGRMVHPVELIGVVVLLCGRAGRVQILSSMLSRKASRSLRPID